MEIIELRLEDVKPYKNNPRKNDKAVQYLIKSIAEFGFRVPIIIDKNNEIIAGHTRYEAMKYLKKETIPCIYADNLTKQQIKAFRIADNKSQEFAEWDEEKLEQELKELLEDNYDYDFEIEIKNDKNNGKKEEGIIKFTSEILEEHNYLVFTFSEAMEWLKVRQFFDIRTVHALDSKKGYERAGIGRVLNGSKLLELIDELL